MTHYDILPKYKVTKKGLESLLCGAFESGGIEYWGEMVGGAISGNADDTYKGPIALMPLLKHGYLTIKDNEAGGTDAKPRYYRLNLDTCKRGLLIMATNYIEHFADFMGDNDDMNTADVFIQCALFGKVKYQ